MRNPGGLEHLRRQGQSRGHPRRLREGEGELEHGHRGEDRRGREGQVRG